MNPLQPINPDNLQPELVDPDGEGWRLCVEAERNNPPHDTEYWDLLYAEWRPRQLMPGTKLSADDTYRTRAPLPVIAQEPADHGCTDEFIERPASPATDATLLLRDIWMEVARATQKFPTWPTDALHAVGVVAEEMGELQKEVMQMTYEPNKSTPETVRKEAVQLAAMSIRFLMSLDRYAYEPRPQHFQLKGGAA